MIDFEGLLRALEVGQVEYVIVGGFAANLHGLARATFDLDVVYRRTPENLERLARALAPLSPYLRDAPPGLPFRLDAETIKRGLNFTLVTTLGSLDLLGEIAGAGQYDHIAPSSEMVPLFGMSVRNISLPLLIAAKRAAGRPKDWESIAELESLLEEGGG